VDGRRHGKGHKENVQEKDKPAKEHVEGSVRHLILLKLDHLCLLIQKHRKKPHQFSG
jgi:hypothetical protein